MEDESTTQKASANRRGIRAVIIICTLVVGVGATFFACRPDLWTKCRAKAASVFALDKPVEAAVLNEGTSSVRSRISSSAPAPSSAPAAAAGSSAITKDGVNVRSGEGTSFPVAFTLVKGTTVQLLTDLTPGTEWVQICTAGGQTGWCAKGLLNAVDTAEAALKNSSSSPKVSLATAPPQVSPEQAKLPLSLSVSIAKQRVTVYDAQSRIVKQFVCSTGMKGSDTPTGTFRIAERGKSFYSKTANEGGYYWTQFKGDYLFHSVPFDKNYQMEPEEAAKLGTAASHGCVRLRMEDAKWIYDHIPRGTAVTVR